MKLLKRLSSAAAALCLLFTLSPRAWADEKEDSSFKDKTWDEVVEEFLTSYNVKPESVALGYYNTVTGEEYYFNADQYMVSGSMYKVPLNMYFLDKIAEGEMDFDTSVGGYRYEYLLEDTIVNSNNDSAKVLWRKIGDGVYRTYRERIAYLFGEDWETVDEKYYENNFTTPRQTITCLRHLYENSDRYEALIAAMQRAEPDNYFKLNEKRFHIAHKYGYLDTDYHFYLTDCAIAYTDEPICMVMYTDNVSSAYKVMTGFCTLMCDYTQYHAAQRLSQQLSTEPEPAAQGLENTPAGESPAGSAGTDSSENASAGGSGSSRLGGLLAGALVLIGVIAAIAVVLRCGRAHKIKILSALLAVFFASTAMLLCIVGSLAGTIIARPAGNPQQAVEEFMDALILGDYTEAYTHLSDYSSLGLENQPSSEAGQAIYQALKDSFSYELYGECMVDKLEARQQVQFTYLDLNAIEGLIAEETTNALEEIVKSRPVNELYDDNNNYLPEIPQEAYSIAVTKVLAHAEDYYTTAGLHLQLTYSGGSWLIVPGQDLLRAITGGAA